jgi:hypothetical protein
VSYPPQDIADARDWLKDLVGDPEAVDLADDDRVVRVVAQRFPGGMPAFIAELDRVGDES